MSVVALLQSLLSQVMYAISELETVFIAINKFRTHSKKISVFSGIHS